MKNIVVTGVSTGIGHAIAKTLTGNNFHVFGSVRKAEDGARLSSEFGAAFTPLVFDVTDEQAVHEAADFVRQKLNGQTLDGLVNNAGIALPGPLLYQSIQNFRQQLEVNVTGQLIAIQAFTPLLGADRTLKGKPGRILNMSSVGGKNGAPFVGAYAASKHALEGLSESLRRELMLFGIDVIIIGPGAISTPIWEKANEMDISEFEKTEYGKVLDGFRKYMTNAGKHGLPAEKLGELVLHIMTTAKPKVRYAIVPQRLKNWTIPQLLPKRMVDNIIAKQLGFKKVR